MKRPQRWVERILDLAERLDDTEMRDRRAIDVGVGLSVVGEDPQSALEQIEKAIALHDSQRQHARRLRIGPYPGVVGLTASALFLWTGGYPDRAYKRAADSILLARELNHPYSLTYAQFHNGLT